jgi:hypothetical protein
LIVRGARQVGKSWLIRNFGVDQFGSVAEANFERDPAIAACFDEADPKASLARLEVVLRRPVPADGATLLFLDEIQAAPRVIARLRYFAQEMPRLPVSPLDRCSTSRSTIRR